MKIKVLVKPNAKKQKVEKVSETEYRVFVNAPPQEGKANEAVMRALASFFDVPKSAIQILTGLHSKIKMIEILRHNLKLR
ncbi:MAG: DUF167 domain-containing protein [Deltaproteobacteria bacterium]|nr:DUF167 domain-containing protein [Deltaproteobacteria bacterium]